MSARWVFKIKDDGRHRARLVVRGCEQQKGVDFNETYSPVLHANLFRLLMALSVLGNYKILKFDIKTAFLYGHLDEEVYIKLPEGFENTNKICKLQKALYGL